MLTEPVYININDLDTNIISKMSKFADDTNLATELETLHDDIMNLQEDINRLAEWANKRQMNFNVDKCSVMHLGHNNMQGNYNISNQQLLTTDQQQDLVIITKDLKWQKQTEKSCKTASRVLGFIARNFRYKSKELILPLYKSLVGPHLEHAVQFWSPHQAGDYCQSTTEPRPVRLCCVSGHSEKY